MPVTTPCGERHRTDRDWQGLFRDRQGRDGIHTRNSFCFFNMNHKSNVFLCSGLKAKSTKLKHRHKYLRPMSQMDNKEEFAKPGAASGVSGRMGTGFRSSARAWPAVGGDETTQGPCIPFPGTDPMPRTTAAGSDLGHRVPWRQNFQQAGPPRRARARARWAAMPPWACAPDSQDEFRLFEDPLSS